MILYGAGRTTGLVLSSSYEITQIYCMFEGFNKPEHHISRKIGGKHMLEEFMKNVSQPKDIANKTKHDIGQVSLDGAAVSKSFTLPDGTSLEVKDCSSFAEPLF